MTIMSDLSGDMVEEILSRVRLTSLRRVRSTCKTWNALSKTLVLGQRAVKKQLMAFMVIDYKICLLRLELQGIHLGDPYLKRIRIPHHHHVHISHVYYCDGILLCVLKDTSTLLVWNPYLGQTRWLRPRPINSSYRTSDMYAIGYGYQNNNRNHKILRFSIYYIKGGTTKYIIDVFDFRSASWRVLHVNPIPGVNLSQLFYYHSRSVSLKGNTYFCVKTKGIKDSLICFDFSTERFGPLLPLPQPYALGFEHVTLSCVRDEKLALLYNHYIMSTTIEIWINTKIEPNAVSWTKFLTLDIKPHNGITDFYWIYYNGLSFCIDEEKKVIVLFNIIPMTGGDQMAYIIGEDGYFKSVNMGVQYSSPSKSRRTVCSSYVPSLVQLQL